MKEGQERRWVGVAERRVWGKLQPQFGFLDDGFQRFIYPSISFK